MKSIVTFTVSACLTLAIPSMGEPPNLPKEAPAQRADEHAREAARTLVINVKTNFFELTFPGEIVVRGDVFIYATSGEDDLLEQRISNLVVAEVDFDKRRVNSVTSQP